MMSASAMAITGGSSAQKVAKTSIVIPFSKTFGCFSKKQKDTKPDEVCRFVSGRGKAGRRDPRRQLSTIACDSAVHLLYRPSVQAMAHPAHFGSGPFPPLVMPFLQGVLVARRASIIPWIVFGCF